MSDRQGHWTIAALGVALSGYCCSLARIAARALDDVQLHQSAALAVMGFAAGLWLLALRPGEHDPSRASRAHAWACTLAAIAMPVGAFVWLRAVARALPASDAAPYVAALPLALPLCIAGYATGLAVRAGRRDFALWLAGAGLGASLSGLAIAASSAERVLAQSCLVAALVALRMARPPVSRRFDALWSSSGLAFMLNLVAAFGVEGLTPMPQQDAALAAWPELRERVLARSARLAPQASASDGFGQLASFGIDDTARGSTGLFVLLRDASPFAAFSQRPAAPCTGSLLGEPYAVPRARVLLAGIGGGLELRCALLLSAGRVDVAEPSRALRAVLRDALDHQLGKLASERIRYHTASARSLVRAAGTQRYDLIVLPATSEKHRLPAGVLPVPEALQKTDRGLAELITALAPEGMLFATVRGEPSALRLATTALAALRELGHAAPEDMIAVEQSGDVYAVMVRRSHFGLDELLALHARAGRANAPDPPSDPLLSELLHGSDGPPVLRYMPGAGVPNRFGALFARADRLAAFQNTYVFDVSAPSDDRPLFNELTLASRAETSFGTSPYRALLLLASFALVLSLVLSIVAWSRARYRSAAPVRAAVALACTGAAQPLVFASVQHALCIRLARPDQSFALVALAMPIGAALGLAYGERCLRGRRLPALFARAIALLVFVLVTVALGPALDRMAHGAVALLAPCALIAVTVLGFALALPACARDPGKRPELAVLLLAAAGAVPSAPAIVLFSGYGALSAVAAALLSLPTLLALRSQA